MARSKIFRIAAWVLVAALFLGCITYAVIKLNQRRQLYLAVAEMHGKTEAHFRTLEKETIRDGVRTRSHKFADYFGGLRQKYEQAARHPWASVEPDPQLPEELEHRGATLPPQEEEQD